jgi:endonuclease III
MIKQDAGIYMWFIHDIRAWALPEIRELIKPPGLHRQRFNYLIGQAGMIVGSSDKLIICDEEVPRQAPGVGD